jgi:exodeoxyribonuclease III
MKVATFNANSIRSRLPVLLSWLEGERPDVLCLQETKVVDELFPLAEIERAGYRAHFRGQKSYNGVAILTREPFEDAGAGLDDDPTDDARLVYGRLGRVWVVNTYVPQGREIEHEMYAYKLAWFRRLAAFFSKRFDPSRDEVLWMGDLNVAREPIDVFEPERRLKHVCYHQDVRDAFERSLAWGWNDVFRAFHPGERQYSFFDYRTPNAAKRGMGWRIDYILATNPLAQRASSSRIDLEPRLQPKASDHTFLVAEFAS